MGSGAGWGFGGGCLIVIYDVRLLLSNSNNLAKKNWIRVAAVKELYLVHCEKCW